MITEAQIRQLCPGARPDIVKHLVANAGSVLPRYGITTPLRMAHFLAQIAHESGGLTIDRESMHYSARRILEVFGPKNKTLGAPGHSAKVTKEEAARLAGDGEALAERVYGLGNPKKARELGNTAPGDGWTYRGAGLIQTTGKASHRKIEAKIGGLIADKPLEAAAAEWDALGCNRIADTNDLRALTRRINGGLNGLADREVLFRRAWGIWGGEDSAPGERALATTKDLAASGSSISRNASAIEATGAVTAAAGAAKSTLDTPVDPTTAIDQTLTQIASARDLVERGQDTLSWLIGHWPIGLVVLGVWLLTTGRLTKLARLRNFRTNQA